MFVDGWSDPIRHSTLSRFDKSLNLTPKKSPTVTLHYTHSLSLSDWLWFYLSIIMFMFCLKHNHWCVHCNQANVLIHIQLLNVKPFRQFLRFFLNFFFSSFILWSVLVNNCYSFLVQMMLSASVLTCCLLFTSSVIGGIAKPEEKRVVDNDLSHAQHFQNEQHNAQYDHEAFLGEDQAKTFDQLAPEESRRRLG